MSIKTPQRTAAQAYAARASDIARLLDVLQMELEAHAAKATARPGDWRFVGDLAAARSDLIKAVGQLSGKTPEEIADFLNDA